MYAPNTDDPEFFHGVHAQILQLDADYVCMGGDFNLLLEPERDSTSESPATKLHAQRALSALCDELGLIDVWRYCRPGDTAYTHYSAQHDDETGLLDCIP